MSEPSFGKLLGISGIIDVPGGTQKFTVAPENVVSWFSSVTLRVEDATGFPGAGDAVDDDGSARVIVIASDGGGSVSAKIRQRGLTGFGNLAGPTNGRGSLVTALGNGYKVTYPIRMYGITASKASATAPLILTFNWRKDGACVEAVIN